MINFIRSIRVPITISLLPFDFNKFDKPVNTVIKPLVEDELGWDRVKRIFCLNEEGKVRKELQSIINITVSGAVIGAFMSIMNVTKTTVDNFISNNEATKFGSHFDAKRALQQEILEKSLKKGARSGGKIGIFCFMFSTITTCTMAYRGKAAVENYVLGGATTGLLYKLNLGPRAALVGAGVGGTLGGLCGIVSILFLYLSGTTMDEILIAQDNWIASRNDQLHEKIIKNIVTEEEEISAAVKQIFEENQKVKLKEQQTKIHDT